MLAASQKNYKSHPWQEEKMKKNIIFILLIVIMNLLSEAKGESDIKNLEKEEPKNNKLKIILEFDSTPINKYNIDQSLEKNMYLLRQMIDTYSIDWGGAFPADLKVLIEKADNKANQYSVNSENIINPYSNKHGIGIDKAIIDFNEFERLKNNVNCSGIIIYQLLENNQGYKIYACQKNNKISEFIIESN